MSGDAGLDIGQLTATQQEALQQYTDVTSQDINAAIPILQRSQWNVQIAIAKFFDGEGPDPEAEAVAAQDAVPRTTARHETLQDSLVASYGHVPRASRTHRTEPAPRVVPQPPSTYRPPILLAVLFAPFQFGHKVLACFVRSLLYVLSFLPPSLRPAAVTGAIRKGWRDTSGRRMLLPRDSAVRFKREFEEEYGQHSLPWFEGGHAQALDAAKKNLKFLLIVLMSPEHDDTESFTRETLLSPQVVSFLNDPANNIILWGGNVLDSEAYQVATEYMCTKFPFSVLVCLTPREGSTRMGIVKRLIGPMTPEAYLAGIQGAIAKYAPDLNNVRDERAVQEMSRNLRSEQDSAYERSLARDRERRRQKLEEQAAAEAAEKRAREEAEAAERRQRLSEQWRRWRAATMAAEPEAGTKDAVRLALNMPVSSGAGRVVRRFAAEATLEEVYAFVECYNLLNQESSALDEKAVEPEDYKHEYAFRISSVMPRETFEPSDNVTVGEKMGKGGNLIVEDVLEEDE